MTATQPPQGTTTIEWLFKNSREVMFVIGADKRFKLVNPAFERETGWSEGEVIGQFARDFLHPDENSNVDAHMARLRDNGFSDNVSRVRMKDGAWRWYEGRAQLTDDGQVIGVMRDATHERERDAKLAEAERTTRMLCQAAGIGAWTYEPGRDEIVWSSDMLALTGYAADDISTMAQIAAILHPDDDVRVRAALMAGITQGEPQSLEHRLKNKSGQWSHWRLTFRTEPRPCGEYALRGVHQDITELVDARDAAVRGEQQILQLIESSPFAVAMFDKQLRCMVVSGSWRQAFSRSQDEPAGRALAEVFPTAPKRLRGAQARALAGEVVNSKEDRFTDSQGRKRWVRWETRPWRDAAGKVQGVICYVDDISALAEARRQAQENARRLKMALTAADAGVYEIDHANKTFWASPEFKKLVGQEKADYQGALNLSYPRFHPDDMCTARRAYSLQSGERTEKWTPRVRQFAQSATGVQPDPSSSLGLRRPLYRGRTTALERASSSHGSCPTHSK